MQEKVSSHTNLPIGKGVSNSKKVASDHNFLIWMSMFEVKWTVDNDNQKVSSNDPLATVAVKPTSLPGSHPNP